MALIFNNLQKLSSTLNSALPKIWGYTDTSVPIATMVASGYFNDFIDNSELKSSDLLLVRGSDNTYLYKYVVSGGNTSLVHPSDISTNPFVYRYVINDTLNYTSTLLASRANAIPHGGFIVEASAVVRDAVILPATNVLKLFAAGNPTPVVELTFPASSGQGTYKSGSAFRGVNAGDNLFWEKPLDSDASSRSFHVSVEVLVIEAA